MYDSKFTEPLLLNQKNLIFRIYDKSSNTYMYESSVILMVV